MKKINRRDFLKKLAVGGVALGVGNKAIDWTFNNPQGVLASENKAVVSVVKIKNDQMDYAVRKAIDLLGGLNSITAGKERIMLKPNLVSQEPRDITKPGIIKALAQLMAEAGKEISIGEGSAAAGPNLRRGVVGNVCRTTDREQLNAIQKIVFDQLGYTELAKSLKIPLINLHTGEMSKVKVPDGFVYKEISLHHSLTEIDLLCSVPMMKTHGLATVTLGIKNLMGLYPGEVYGTVRSAVHTEAAKVESSGTASALIDMVRANKLGLVVIDASTAMEGQGPSVHQGGRLVKMDLIIAGTNPLATDMVASSIMGFRPEEISTFTWAWKAGLKPASLEEIEIRGEKLESIKQNFIKPMVIPWDYMREYGPPC